MISAWMHCGCTAQLRLVPMQGSGESAGMSEKHPAGANGVSYAERNQQNSNNNDGHSNTIRSVCTVQLAVVMHAASLVPGVHGLSLRVGHVELFIDD